MAGGRGDLVLVFSDVDRTSAVGSGAAARGDRAVHL